MRDKYKCTQNPSEVNDALGNFYNENCYSVCESYGRVFLDSYYGDEGAGCYTQRDADKLVCNGNGTAKSTASGVSCDTSSQPVGETLTAIGYVGTGVAQGLNDFFGWGSSSVTDNPYEEDKNYTSLIFLFLLILFIVLVGGLIMKKS